MPDSGGDDRRLLAVLFSFGAAAFGLLRSLEPALGALFGYLVAHQHLRPTASSRSA